MFKKYFKSALKELSLKVSRSVFQELQQDNLKKNDDLLLSLGALLSKLQWNYQNSKWHEKEFKIFSQWGDDGLIQFLVNNIDLKSKTFIEFGVEDYTESNTRFLLMNNNFSGAVIDGSELNINRIKNSYYYWKYELSAIHSWITKENINKLLSNIGYTEIDVLSIDIDGNEYHILKEIDFTRFKTSILIIEYNSVFGSNRFITIPYKKDFYRTNEHYSNLFFGASLAALTKEAQKKGFALVGSNLAGSNAYFVRYDLLNERIFEKTVEDVFVESKIRESRDVEGNLNYLMGAQRLELIKGLKVENTLKNELEDL